MQTIIFSYIYPPTIGGFFMLCHHPVLSSLPAPVVYIAHSNIVFNATRSLSKMSLYLFYVRLRKSPKAAPQTPPKI